MSVFACYKAASAAFKIYFMPDTENAEASITTFLACSKQIQQDQDEVS